MAVQPVRKLCYGWITTCLAPPSWKFILAIPAFTIGPSTAKRSPWPQARNRRNLRPAYLCILF
jgi:hypothetical protein